MKAKKSWNFSFDLAQRPHSRHTWRMIRLFAALDIPDEIARRLSALQSGLQECRWQTRENMHVTLRFMGSLEEPMAEEIDYALAHIKCKPFKLRINELGSFGDGERARTVWAGAEKSDALLNLHTKVENALQVLGLEPDKRKYAPHITLGRLKHSTPADVAHWIEGKGQFHALEFEATRMVLYSTHTTSSGSAYHPERYYVF